MTTFILIRHGETLWNRQRRYQGHNRVGLTLQGKKAVRVLSIKLKKLKGDILYASPLRRAKESAAILSKALALKPVFDARLKEIDFGSWEGKTAEELLQKNKAYQQWVQGKRRFPCPGESLASFRRRVIHFLRECVRRHSGKNILIVSHGGPIKIMAAELKQTRLRFHVPSIKPATALIVSL